jgi:hypothetical protein
MVTQKTTMTDLKSELITSYLKYYKWELPIPSFIMEEIDQMEETNGYDCWFADWLNHRLYTWIFSFCLVRELSVPEYKDFEDIKYYKNKND